MCVEENTRLSLLSINVLSGRLMDMLDTPGTRKSRFRAMERTDIVTAAAVAAAVAATVSYSTSFSFLP